MADILTSGCVRVFTFRLAYIIGLIIHIIINDGHALFGEYIPNSHLV